MTDLLSNPFWNALRTEQTRFAVGQNLALRYPPDILPFAGSDQSNSESSAALRGLLQPGERIFVASDVVRMVDGLEQVDELPGLQMHFDPKAPSSEASTANDVEIRTLTGADAQDMIALTDVAFPGFFRERTYLLGAYRGIYLEGQLISMAGERIALPGLREISAVCTHPAHIGRGYATLLIQHLLRFHQVNGLSSFLHVAAANERALNLYRRLGFNIARPIIFRQLRRT